MSETARARLDARSIAPSEPGTDRNPRPGGAAAREAVRSRPREIREEGTIASTHSDLVDRVSRGEYIVDAQAVAEAMLSRFSIHRSGSCSPGVLVPGEVDRRSAGVEQAHPRPELDLS